MMFNFFARSTPKTPEVYVAASDLVTNFESLGDNCEFGFVQRFCGAEPLGLFRFSYSQSESLVHALETGFAHYGGPDDLEVFVGPPNDEIFCKSRRYQFAYHTGEFAAKISLEAALAREIKKVSYLKQRLLSDLQSGEKICIRKAAAGEGADDARRLVSALRRYGPNTLIWAVPADADHAPGEVEAIEEGLLKGHIAHFAPPTHAQNLHLESWLEVCRRAYCLWKGLPGDAAQLPPARDVAPAYAGPVEPGPAAASPPSVAVGDCPNSLDYIVLPHRLAVGPTSEEELAATLPVRPGLPIGRIYAVSLEVWVPEDFRGSRVSVSLPGNLISGHREADLSRRNCWQQIWAATKLSKKRNTLSPGLLVLGEPGAVVYSADWRIEEAPVPSKSRMGVAGS